MEIDLIPKPLTDGHFDRNSPLSLYSKMGSHWAERFLSKVREIPGVEDLLSDETVLKEWLDANYQYSPTNVDNRYRLQLWLEYDNAVKKNRLMNMSNVYNLVGPETTFHKLVMKNPCRVAWMLSKPVGYATQMREILNTGLARMAKILDMDPFPKGEKPDLKLAKLQLDITKMMDLRMHGAPTQKILEISTKATLGANGEIQEFVEQADMKSLMERKVHLEKRKAASEGRGQGGGAGSLPTQDAEVVDESKDAG